MHYSENDLVEYYFKYIDLVKIHQRLKFGEAPRTSEGFTESLCSHLYGFTKAKNVKREYDLDDPVTNSKIEVKATVSDVGSTTINPIAQFDYLYWLIFRLDLDCLWVKKISFQEVQNYIQKKNLSGKRVNITLGDIDSSFKNMDMFELSNKSFTIRKLDYNEMIEIIKSKLS